MSREDARIARAILDLVDARADGATICPSEAARALSDDEPTWRALMPEVRRVAADLAARGRLRVTSHGQDVSALEASGPIRLGRPAISLPQGKSDLDGARAVVALGYPAVAPALAGMLEWVQDENWGVAAVFLPFLGTVGAPLEPHLRRVLQSDDGGWKDVVIRHLVAPSPTLASLLHDELERLADHPTADDRREAVHDQARAALVDNGL